ncbi:Solute carrier family 35 member G1 [Holothuria leucospilota]|uniref:Solute carrier family 35 member G1 n=1 Tax=Holothuria leucospilota TaxID=206669 RepID=A0A9Q1BYE7_HOLLE|nr:Solute carrier family 35 member G1 [Holothuria leucospilota]
MTVSPFQVVVTSMSVVIVTSLVLIIYKRIPPPSEVKQYIWFLPSGISIAFLNASNVFAVTYMGLADVVTILQLSVIFVGFFSWIILKEPPRVIDFIFAAIAIVNVVFATRPSFIFGQSNGDNHTNYDSLRGVTFALLSAPLIAIANVVVRKQSKLDIQPYISSFANALQSTLINLIVCIATQNWACPSRIDLLTLFAAGLSYTIVQISLYMAFSLESATVVSIILTVQIVIAFLWQFIFYRLVPIWTSALGGALVMVACIGSMVKRNKPIQNTQGTREL